MRTPPIFLSFELSEMNSTHSNSHLIACQFCTRPAAMLRAMMPHQLATALAASSLLTLCVWPGLQSVGAQTLPSGLNVVQGSARTTTTGNTLTITNSPGALLNWNSFSIGAQNTVRFDQVNASSQVLNRVVGNDPSSILGRLSSNGKVWLLNQNGILFGQSARVDVAGLVASTLNLADNDWSAGRYVFSGYGSNATGSIEIVNQGEIRTGLGGRVMLIGTSVRNEGLIEALGGQILLAAGQSVELVDTGAPNVGVKVSAPQGSALNLGTLVASGGRIDIHAAIVNQQGIIRANSLEVANGAGGEIVLSASQSVTLGSNSLTLADGTSGGKVTINAGSGSNMISGQVSATGSTGQGGQVQLLGRQVGLTGSAGIDVSGASGGGRVLVGGGQQGLDANVTNADAVYFSPDARIAADATANGDGGKIILWSNQSTRAYGSLSARGGLEMGNGGFIETSSGYSLDARPLKINTQASHGTAGQWLIDPYDLTISDYFQGSTSAPLRTSNIQPGSYFTASGDSAQLLSSDINAALQAGTQVTLSTGVRAGSQQGNVTFSNAHIQQASSGPMGQLNVVASGNIVVDGSTLGSGAGASLSISLKAGLSGEGTVSIVNNSAVQTKGGNLDIYGTTGKALAAVNVDSLTLNADSLNIQGVQHSSIGTTTGVLISNSNLQADNISVVGSAVPSSSPSTGVLLTRSYITGTESILVSGTGGGTGVKLDGGTALTLAPLGFNPNASLTITGANTAASSGYGVYINATSDAPAVNSYSGATVSITGETAGPVVGGSSGNTVGIYGIGSNYVAAQIVSSGALNLRSGHDIQLHDFGLQTDSSMSLAAPNIAVYNPALSSFQTSTGNFTVSADTLYFGAGTRFQSNATGDWAMRLMGFSNSGILTVQNNAGNVALSAPNGRWLLYQLTPFDKASYGVSDLGYGFKQYHSSLGAPVLHSGNGLVYIVPMDAALVADVIVRDYNGSAQVSASNFRIETITGDTATGITLGASPAYADANAGVNKPVRVGEFSVASFQDAKDKPVYGYNLLNNVTGTVLPKPLQWSVQAKNKVYDGTVVASGALLQPPVGLVGTETLGINIFGAFSDQNVGVQKPVFFQFQLVDGTGGGSASNYSAPPGNQLTYASITAAPLQYLAYSASKAFGRAKPYLDGAVTGFVGPDTQQSSTSGVATFTSTAGAQSLPGQYAVQGSGLSARNYSFGQAASNLTALTITDATPGLSQGSNVALTQVLTLPTVTINIASSGMVDFLQTPASSKQSADSMPSFSGVSLEDMSFNEVVAMLAARNTYKKALFANAIGQLEQDASLADLPTCQSRVDAELGKCLLTGELKQQIQASKQPQIQVAQQPSQPQILLSAAPSRVPSPLLTVAPSSQLQLQNINLAQKRTVMSAALPQIERKVAVVIGVDRYEDKLIPSLGNAVSDARSVGSLLESELGYETVVIADASKQAVISAMNKLAIELNFKDSVVVYYAGHGELIDATGQGYWLLADSDSRQPKTWLSNADINRMVAQIGASQVALISDSCYSGSLVSDNYISTASGSLDPAKLLTQKSVVVMSSGGNEPVFDQGRNGHSPFAYNLMDQLKQVKKWQPGVNVFARVRFAVARELPQRPKYGWSSTAGHQGGGDYLFEQRRLNAVK